MGFLSKLHQKEKNRKQKEVVSNVEKFKFLVSRLGKTFGMAIVPINTKYGLEVEIQILQDKTNEEVEKALLEFYPIKEEIEIKVENKTTERLMNGDDKPLPEELTLEDLPIEEGHSKDLSKKI